MQILPQRNGLPSTKRPVAATRRSIGFVLLLAVASLLAPATTYSGDPPWQSDAAAVYLPGLDPVQSREAADLLRQTSPIRQATMLQPTPFVQPRPNTLTSGDANTAEPTLIAQLAQSDVDQSLLAQQRRGIPAMSVDLVQGSESQPLSATDVGDLLGKSPAALSVEVQRRTPIINDPRVRSSRIGAIAASGSHWVPSRIDLDTALSKIDSRLVGDIVVIPGPYSSLHGPGFQFIDFQLLRSPRSESGTEWHGRSSFDHSSNGNQWLGQQSVWGGGENWGVRASYAHRTGSDYRAGDGGKVPASYESREATISLGFDLDDERSIEFSLLRLDQTDVDFPGYVFDIESLVTDAYGINYVDAHPWIADRMTTDVWYNRTRFAGNAQNAAKGGQFPILDSISYFGETDVDSLSTGYRQGYVWGEPADFQLTLGHDVRFIKQELNELSNGLPLGGTAPIGLSNSPIPRSFSVNPGVFAEYTEDFQEDWTFRTGGRIDFVQTDVVEDASNLQDLTFDTNGASINQILGTDDLQTDRFLWSVFGSLQHQFSDRMSGSMSVGYAQRPPSLTELYAVEPFILLLQNGLNTVTGDPRLDEEKLIQMDASLDFDGDNLRYGFRGFHAWGLDYITFENTSTLRAGQNNEVQQVSLQYVNTDLATLVGGEAYIELYPDRMLTPFGQIRFVDGRDRTRRGDGATNPGSATNDRQTVDGQPRGAFSFVDGGDSEPLPGISPLESRVGLRVTDPVDARWNVELAARIVDNQDRVATSLLESQTPGFTVFDIRSNYQVNDRGLTIHTGVENLLDKTYREHLDFRSFTGQSIRQPGVNFYFGADWTY